MTSQVSQQRVPFYSTLGVPSRTLVLISCAPRHRRDRNRASRWRREHLLSPQAAGECACRHAWRNARRLVRLATGAGTVDPLDRGVAVVRRSKPTMAGLRTLDDANAVPVISVCAGIRPVPQTATHSSTEQRGRQGVLWAHRFLACHPDVLAVPQGQSGDLGVEPISGLSTTSGTDRRQRTRGGSRVRDGE